MSQNKPFLIPTTKSEWIRLASAQELLDTGNYEVVPCVNCDDMVCHGWKLQPKQYIQNTP